MDAGLQAIIVAVIVATPPTILAWRTTRKVEKVESKVQAIDVKVDGRLSELLGTTKDLFQAIGRDEERANPTGPYTSPLVQQAGEAAAVAGMAPVPVTVVANVPIPVVVVPPVEPNEADM